MEEQKKKMKSNRLKKLEENLLQIIKTRDYLEKEIFQIKDKETKIKEKIKKERQAISLVNKAKKLRFQKK